MSVDDGLLIAVEGVALAHGARTVLTGVDLRIASGERWFIAGPNGAGKTTLVRALLGQQALAAGRLRLGAALADRRRLGYVPQQVAVPAVVPTTVREFTALGLVGLQRAGVHRHGRGPSRAAREARLTAALAGVGLLDHAHQALATCSGGQRQRAAIARALVREPLLLICDEPTASLDHRAAAEVLAAIRVRAELASVVVAHDLALIAAHATHVALVAHGRLRAGPVADLLMPAHLEWAFAARPVAAVAGVVVRAGSAVERGP